MTLVALPAVSFCVPVGSAELQKPNARNIVPVRFKEHVQNNNPKHFLSEEEFIQLRVELSKANMATVTGEDGEPAAACDEELPPGMEDLPDPAKVCHNNPSHSGFMCLQACTPAHRYNQKDGILLRSFFFFFVSQYRSIYAHDDTSCRQAGHGS